MLALERDFRQDGQIVRHAEQMLAYGDHLIDEGAKVLLEILVQSRFSQLHDDGEILGRVGHVVLCREELQESRAARPTT